MGTSYVVLSFIFVLYIFTYTLYIKFPCGISTPSLSCTVVHGDLLFSLLLLSCCVTEVPNISAHNVLHTCIHLFNHTLRESTITNKWNCTKRWFRISCWLHSCSTFLLLEHKMYIFIAHTLHTCTVYINKYVCTQNSPLSKCTPYVLYMNIYKYSMPISTCFHVNYCSCAVFLSI